MEVGSRFNPFRIFRGIFIPNCILQLQELTSSAKLLYGRLLQYAGEDGHCYPSQETLAQETALAIRTVINGIKELENFKLLEIDRPKGEGKLLHKTSRYYFLWHDCMSTVPAKFSTPVPATDAPPKKENQNKKRISKSIPFGNTSEAGASPVVSKASLIRANKQKIHPSTPKRKPSSQKKKTPPTLSSDAQQVYEYWQSKGLPTSDPKRAKVAYADDMLRLNRLVDGTEYEGSDLEVYKFSMEEVKSCIDKLVQRGLKMKIGKFIHNPHSASPVGKSWLQHFLTHEAVTVKPAHDSNPELTAALKAEYIKKITGYTNPPKFTVQDCNHFISAAQKVKVYAHKHRDYLVQRYFSKPRDIAEAMIGAIISIPNLKLISVNPAWLSSDKHFSQRLPEYLLEQNILREEFFAIDQKPKKFYKPISEPLDS